VALHLIRKRETLLGPLAEALRVAQECIVTCSVCGNVDTRDPCTICSDERRDATTLVVVESVGDLWALERAGATRARYHVLGGALSPLDGVGPSDLNFSALVARVEKADVRELILAVNATVEGQTTAHYILDLLVDSAVKVTRLAHGVPVGGELDYLDDGTLAAAIRQRTAF
jgi:recombination protein RecR